MQGVRAPDTHNLHAATDKAQGAGAGVDGKLGIGFIASPSFRAFRDLVADYVFKQRDAEFVFVEADRSELLTLLSHRVLDVVMASGEFSDARGDSRLMAGHASR